MKYLIIAVVIVLILLIYYYFFVENNITYYSLEDMHRIKAETGQFPTLTPDEEELRNRVMTELNKRGLGTYSTTPETTQIVAEQKAQMDAEKRAEQQVLDDAEKRAEQVINTIFGGTDVTQYKERARIVVMQLVTSQYKVSKTILNDDEMARIAAGFKILKLQNDADKLIDEKIDDMFKYTTDPKIDPVELKHRSSEAFNKFILNLGNLNNTTLDAAVDSIIAEQKALMEREDEAIEYPYEYIPTRSALMKNTNEFGGLHGRLNYQNMPLTNIWMRCRDDRGHDCYWNGKVIQNRSDEPLTDNAYITVQQPHNHNLTKPLNVKHLADAGPLTCPDRHVMTEFGINPVSKLMFAKCQKSKISPNYTSFDKSTESGIDPKDGVERTHQLDRFYFNCPNGTALNSIAPTYDADSYTLKFDYKCIT